MGLGSFFKKLGKGALKVAPFAAMAIPGIGPLASAAIQGGLGAANAKVSGGGLKNVLLGAGMGSGLGKGLAPSKGFLSNLGSIGKGILKNPSSVLSGLMPGESGGMPTKKKDTSKQDTQGRQRSPIGPTRVVPRMDQTTPNLAFPLEYGRQQALGRRRPSVPPYMSY